MPAYTLNRRTMPDDMQAAINAHLARHGATQCETGKRTLAPSIARAPENGATRDDIRAATFGLITLATKARR